MTLISLFMANCVFGLSAQTLLTKDIEFDGQLLIDDVTFSLTIISFSDHESKGKHFIYYITRFSRNNNFEYFQKNSGFWISSISTFCSKS